VRKKIPAAPVSSMPTWDTLEAFVRMQIQATMQSVLEEELSVFLGRGKSERVTFRAIGSHRFRA